MDNFKNPRFISPNCVMIEVILTANGGNVPNSTTFAEQQQLVNRPIVAIEVFNSTDMTYSPISSGVPVIPPSIMNCGFLNIQRSGGHVGAKDGLYYKLIPLSRLRSMINFNSAINPQSSSTPNLYQVKPMFFSWPDSTITFPTSVAMGVARWSVPILVHYLLQGENSHPYE